MVTWGTELLCVCEFRETKVFFFNFFKIFFSNEHPNHKKEFKFFASWSLDQANGVRLESKTCLFFCLKNDEINLA